MYKSPITINMMDELTQHYIKQIEDGIVASVCEFMHIDIDKEELEKALRYDRYQYEHGYADGHASGYKERDEEIARCKDCKYWDSNGIGICKLHDIRPTPLIMDNWFCADGELRDDRT